jgi:hypothetical protein
MGSWGTGVYENDSAADWAQWLAKSEGLSRIESAFDALHELVDEDDPHAVIFVDADDAIHAIAAADIVARLIGVAREQNAYCEEAVKWVEARRGKLMASAELVDKAIAALDLALTPRSELHGMWADNGTDSPSYLAWRASVAELRQQLVAARPTA